MDADLKVLLMFSFLVTSWITLPVIPAWLTFRITPNQSLGLNGPLQGLTLQATGAFAAYLVVLLTITLFASSIGYSIMGRAIADSTWTIHGRVKLENAEGATANSPPNLEKFAIRIAPTPNVIDQFNLSLKIPIADNRRPVIYVDIPDWGGGRVSLEDPSLYEEDRLNRTIKLKGVVILREQPKERSIIGPTLPVN